jgi:hypothetical protein
LQEVDDSVHIGQFLGTRSLAALTKEGRELESLTDGGVRLVYVELLAVTGGSLERDRERAAIHHDLAINGTVGLALSQDIEQSRLTGTGTSHQSSQLF